MGWSNITPARVIDGCSRFLLNHKTGLVFELEWQNNYIKINYRFIRGVYFVFCWVLYAGMIAFQSSLTGRNCFWIRNPSDESLGYWQSSPYGTSKRYKFRNYSGGHQKKLLLTPPTCPAALFVGPARHFCGGCICCLAGIFLTLERGTFEPWTWVVATFK